MKDYIPNKTIDVIIPIYNTPAHLLEYCLLSVLGQTYKRVRIIAIDDGSTRKETLDIIEKFSNNKIVKLYKQKNAGVSAARNKGLECSDGDYVFFLDSDDYIDEGYLERLLDVLQKQQVGLVFSGRIKIPGNNNDAPFENHRINIERDSDLIALKAHAFTCNAVLIEGKLARSERFTTTTTMGEDTEYIVKIMAKNVSLFEGKGGCYYVQNPESLTHETNIESIQRFLDESVLEAKVLKKYIKISERIYNVFLYQKLVGGYQKLSLNYSIKESHEIAKKHIEKYNFKKIAPATIVGLSLLNSGQKIKILMLNYRLYGVLWFLNRLIAAYRKRGI